MTVAADELARIGSVLVEWRREDALRPRAPQEDLPQRAREVSALREALQPIIGIVIKLGADLAPGTDAHNDSEWSAVVAMARHDVLSREAGGSDRALNAISLRLLDRIDALIGNPPDSEFQGLARRRVRELVDARRRGRQRGLELRRQRPDVEVPAGVSVGWSLRHPADHWLRHALPRISDPQCRDLITAQIHTLAPSYEHLCAQDWTAEQQAAEVVYETRVIDSSPGSWTKPIPATVTASMRGDASPGDLIAVRLVEDLEASFDGTLVSLLPGERWLVCARELPDGTLLPLDATRRCAPS